MAKYQHAYVIPDGAKIKGGILYDKFGNLSFFADVDALEDKTQSAKDFEIPVKQSSVQYYMRSKAKFTRSATTAYGSKGLQQMKGAIPGHTMTFVSGDKKRQFQYNGNDSGLVAWLKDNAKVEISLYGPSGTPYDPIPAAGGGD